MEDFKAAAKINGISRMYLLKRWLLDFAYPNRCPFCDKIIPFDEYYCAGCGSPCLQTDHVEEMSADRKVL